MKFSHFSPWLGLSCRDPNERGYTLKAPLLLVDEIDFHPFIHTIFIHFSCPTLVVVMQPWRRRRRLSLRLHAFQSFYFRFSWMDAFFPPLLGLLVSQLNSFTSFIFFVTTNDGSDWVAGLLRFVVFYCLCVFVFVPLQIVRIGSEYTGKYE